MEKTIATVGLIAYIGVALYIGYRVYNMDDGPTNSEILDAIEKGASNLTVSPMTVSDN